MKPARPFALSKDDGEALWFLGDLVIVKASGETTGGCFSIIENVSPGGAGSPLHVHRREDEWFYILEGELTFWVDGRRIDASAGSFVYGPRDVPHTYVVNSEQARFIVGVEPAGFENFVRAVSEPAQSRTLPPPAVEPPDTARLAAIAAQYGIEVLGPPGIPA